MRNQKKDLPSLNLRKDKYKFYYKIKKMNFNKQLNSNNNKYKKFKLLLI